MQRPIALGLILLGLCGCGPSTDDLQPLAARGAIQEDAPVKAEAGISIEAPPAKVWAILADIGGWPRWQDDISDVSIAQSPAVGVQFTWSLSQSRIKSRIALFDPERSIGWTGRAFFMAHAVHVWTLTALPDGGTKVETRESMSGPMISAFFSSAQLLESDRIWLGRLKTAAEM